MQAFLVYIEFDFEEVEVHPGVSFCFSCERTACVIHYKSKSVVSDFWEVSGFFFHSLVKFCLFYEA